MSLRPQTVPPVPEETAHIARSAFPKDNLYLQIRDEIGVLLGDADFAAFFPTRLLTAKAENLVFDKFLGWCRERNVLKTRGK